MSAPQAHPSYVLRVRKDGRRVYDPKFKAGVVADYRSGKASAAELTKRHKLPENCVYMWASVAAIKRKPTNSIAHATREHKSLLDAALAWTKQEPVQRELNTSRVNQELDLAIAYVQDRVTRQAVRKALGITRGGKFMFTSWLGRVMSDAVRIGRIK